MGFGNRVRRGATHPTLIQATLATHVGYACCWGWGRLKGRTRVCAYRTPYVGIGSFMWSTACLGYFTVDN
ncbi:hypothetical protein [Neisseria sp. P0017.S009]|uniref:hypothetical protein n=1 Tax=Neisseria sp. P0017.S009 TaxID=3436785 RepID=UPI003F7DE329